MVKKTRISKNNINFLKAISRLDSNGFAQITPLLKTAHINLICELCRNVLFSKFGQKLGKKSFNKIKKITKPNRNLWLNLANKNVSTQKKRKIISQRGGMLGTIISLAVPLITSLISAFTK